MMAAYLLRADTPGHELARWERLYMRLADWCLAHRVKTAVITIVFFFGVLIGLTPLLPAGFMPPDDLPQTQVMLTLPPGSTLVQAQSVVAQAEAVVRKHPQVKSVYTAFGGGASGADPFAPKGAAEVGKATLTINLSARSERRGISKQDIEADFRQQLQDIAGVRIKVGFGGSSEKYQMSLAGDDGEVLLEQARKIEREMRSGIPGIGAITTNASLVRPELVIRPDFARAADLGVSAAAIADTLRVALAGDYDQSLAKLNLAQRQVPVMVKLRDSARQDLDLISRLNVPGARGPVSLANVASITLDGGPAQINRYDRRRSVNFEIELNGQPLGEVEALVQKLPSVRQLPPGVTQTAFGDAEAMGELFTGFSMAMGAGVLCIYIVLILLFKDFVQPVTILAALVLSVPGAILALFVTRNALTMPAMIGMIMLMGIATKNSILLVEYVIMARRDHGLGRLDALLDACRKRARPIVMTTVAMGAGMLPIAIGMGTDPSFRAPMAIVIIGGLITSTFLSLLVIPVLFTYVDDARLWALQVLRRKRA
jgi:multidrug efflux pump subunit AcrB